MQKIRKILRAVSAKTALPTNQAIITNNTDFLGSGWRWSNKLQPETITLKHQQKGA